MTPLAIGFLGAGQMASALASGWLKAGLVDPSRSLAADPVPIARTKFLEVTGVQAIDSNRKVVESCDVLVLAVKP
jgi:pyrroline-5-carboxylate reductase